MNHQPQPRPGDPEISPELVENHGLNEAEYASILAILGREPTYAELGVFSAMWSEHCGYKHSRPLLRNLPTESAAVVQGPGENAGVVSVGGDWCVAFKIESHNHPSAIEPYQGAATGAGGILRDVFTMGARPVALFDSLHFGTLDDPRSRYLFDGVVRGVGDYGNCVGVPTVGGEAIFDAAYEKNPLINVMCVGVLPVSRLIRGEAEGVGNAVMAVGARTGRDGIHGATFASEELDEDATSSRPQVQVGDPFTEKLLLEASLELISRELLVGIQDMGAAGLTSSATEMSSRSGSGIEINVRHLPVREENMTPYEMLLSESQERMLLVAKPGCEEAVQEVLARWDLQAAVIGKVTDDGMFRVREGDALVAEIPVRPLVDECPTYEPEARESDEVEAQRSRLDEIDPEALLEKTGGAARALLSLLDDPTIADKRWISEQYDTTVQTNTLAGPGGDAAVLRLPDRTRGIAISTDGNGRHTYLRPRTGGRAAVAEAARNVACTGARPLAMTNCLNFGSPLRPSVYFQLREAVAGMGEACEALGTPVTGGNVSLYNETGGTPVYPTPVVGMIGVLKDISRRVGSAFTDEGGEIWLAGVTREELGGSAFLAVCTTDDQGNPIVAGEPPEVVLEAAANLVEFLVTGAEAGVFRSAHDCSDGGLAVALAECAIAGGQGFDVFLDRAPGGDSVSGATLWFGETHSRAVVTAAPEDADRVREIGAECGIPIERIGVVGGVVCRIEGGGHVAELDLTRLSERYKSAIPGRMGSEPVGVAR